MEDNIILEIKDQMDQSEINEDEKQLANVDNQSGNNTKKGCKC